ncbi:AMP-dependent synthetase and ligase [Intrasporangium calvum DSM 43043]|uniref:AMP-dependent synthetase and ligase n=2 Tax=Intrasporangium calvum TaxID=53358 RepID=E6SCL3_INTC7|nr:AMP-dependent synthetase and ligase [Intrasporangium calvum DSM 43043]
MPPMIDLVGNRTLRDLLEERVSRHPNKPCLVFEAQDGEVREWTYVEMLSEVDRLASGLSELGVGKGDKITVHLANSPEFLMTLYAAATLGAIVVPSNVSNRPAELRHILSYSDSIAVITEPAFLSVVDEAVQSVPEIRQRIMARTKEKRDGWLLFTDIQEAGRATVVCTATSEDVVEMLFTSGTTARPKGVLLTHANLLRSGERSSKSMYLTSDERCLTALPVFHVNAQSLTVLSALTVGGTCILLEEYRASKFWDQVRAHDATQISLVAMLARTMLAQPPRETDRDHRVRRVFYALNVTDAEREQFESRFGVELVNGYGLSEAMTIVTVAPVFGPKRWPSIGLPAYDRLVRIVDVEGNDLPPGTPGELIVHGIPGRTLMKGYYKDPEGTARAIRDNWLYTGDNAYMDDKGYFYFFDRKKDVIKRAGENISASEVEFVLVDHPQIVEAAVIGVADDIRDEAVKAFVVAEPGSGLTEEAIQQYCREHLAHFKVPTIIELREALPKTSIGKIEKKLLRQESDK